MAVYFLNSNVRGNYPVVEMHISLEALKATYPNAGQMGWVISSVPELDSAKKFFNGQSWHLSLLDDISPADLED